MIVIDKNVAIEKQFHFIDNHTSILGIYCPQIKAAFAAVYIAPENDFTQTMEGLEKLESF